MSKWDANAAEWYAANYGEYATNKLGLEAVSLSADSVVVDIGCGTGCALRHAAKVVSHGQLIGVDAVPRMLEIAREQSASCAAAKRLSYRLGGAEELPIEDDFADVVLAFDSLDHWADQAKGLQEVKRVLKPSGQFAVVKDGGLPGGDAAKKNFVAALNTAGFRLLSAHHVSKDEVEFTQWICEHNS